MSYICLLQTSISSFPRALSFAQQNGYGVIAAPINLMELPYETELEPMKDNQHEFTYADLVLNSEQWNQKVICILSEEIDCDSLEESVRRKSEEILKRDISWAEHLQFCGHTLIKLKSDRVVNLARIVTTSIKGLVTVQVPMFDARKIQAKYRSDVDLSALDYEDTWHWWNRFRWAADFNHKLKVVLELSKYEVPTLENVRRWIGEPLEAIIIPANIFVMNRQNYPMLPAHWQNVLKHFISSHVNMIVSACHDDNNLKAYHEVLYSFRETYRDQHALNNFENMLEIPLQPLNDNLDCYTYEVFEKDPVKYKLYQDAIEAALQDRVSEEEKNKKLTVIMVLGAGRGPLVRAALNAAENTKRKVRIYIIEKNPNAIRTLTNIARKLWHNKDVHIFSKDMREVSPPEEADILVSELLGSFGDNELSPECLDGAQKLLKAGGISIPNASISYLNPIMSMKLLNALRHATKNDTNPRDKMSSWHNCMESGCVVMLKNIYNIGTPKDLFKFEHPNLSKTDNTRYKALQFEVTSDCMVNGFAGYFEAILYKDIMISINPQTHTQSMHSWFPMFFPLTEPVQVKKGDIIEVQFWRCVSKQKVWYEWCISSPKQSYIHNQGGHAYPIYCT